MSSIQQITIDGEVYGVEPPIEIGDRDPESMSSLGEIAALSVHPADRSEHDGFSALSDRHQALVDELLQFEVHSLARIRQQGFSTYDFAPFLQKIMPGHSFLRVSES